MANLSVAVVICAYTMERLEDIDRAVDSIRSQRHPADELILVIDHNDELARLVRDRFQDVRVITNVEARGLSGGRNTGIAGATSDVVAFLDDDAQAHTDWLETMLPWYADQSIIAVGGSSQPVWRSGRPTWFPVEFDWVVGCSYRGLPIKAADVRNLIGSNMSFRREVFAKVGGFHSAIGRVGARPVGCEETELCIRAARQIPGSRIVYDPVVSVSHYLPEGRARWRYFRSRCYAEGLSKAIVAELTGPDRGLASERSYVTHTLPAGIVTGVREAVRERTMAPLRRAGVIIVGLGLTSTGFVVGSTRRLWSRVEQVPRSELVPPKIGNPELREPTRAAMADLTVVIPARNAAMFIEECLESVLASGPAEVIVVDGKSTDATRAIASRYPVRLLDDGGRGVAAARVMGATAARTEWVALVDVDVLLPPGALAALLDEAGDGGYTALQAGLERTSGSGYWGRALVDHHRSGLSKHWFGLVATIFRRDVFLRHGLDATFASGEDIEMRFRLERSGEHIGVSARTIVPHRFGDTFEFARGQFQADGAGLARMAVKHGWRAAPLLALPAAAALRGIVLSLARGRPQWIPYYVTFLALNWFAMGRQLLTRVVWRRQ